VTRDEAKTVWDAVVENLERLEGCAGPHVFVVTPETAAQTFGRRFRCTGCGGELTAVNQGWYEKGLEHGKRDARTHHAQGVHRMKHVMIQELEVEGEKGRPTGFEVCAWCGVRRSIDVRVGEDTEDCVGKPESVRGGKPSAP
jgi:hypothetical protein